MHEYYQNKLTLHQEQKYIVNLTEDFLRLFKNLRQHTTSADKKEYFGGTIFRY